MNHTATPTDTYEDRALSRAVIEYLETVQCPPDEWDPLDTDESQVDAIRAVLYAALDWDYTRTMDEIGRIYGKRIRSILAIIADEAWTQGYTPTEIIDLTDQEYRWDIGIKGIPGFDPDDTVAIEVTILEERVTEGTEIGMGVAFDVTVVHDAGRLLGQFCLHNFTPQLWDAKIHDLPAVEDRWLATQGALCDVLAFIEAEGRARIEMGES